MSSFLLAPVRIGRPDRRQLNHAIRRRRAIAPPRLGSPAPLSRRATAPSVSASVAWAASAVLRAVGLPWSRQVWGGVSRGARAERLAETTRAASPHAFAITALAAVLLSLAAATAVAILRRHRAAMRTAKPPTLEPVRIHGESNAAAVAGSGEATNCRLLSTKRAGAQRVVLALSAL
jgi:hypothetical protein